MIKNIIVPESLASRNEFKKKYNIWEMYCAMVLIPAAIAQLIKNKRKHLLDRKFIERLQLAVTEVSGCAACSYAHTYMALKQGMSNNEIQSLLSGEGSFIKPEEAKAIFFVQHFADFRGYPEKDAYQAIELEYGKERARIILAAAQVMIAGNMYGIPYSAFMARLKGKAFKDSTLFYELGMQVAGFIFLPIALIHGVLRSILGFSALRFKKD